jgi:hypothetical protein
MAKDTAAMIIKILKRLDLVIIFRSYPEPDMLTLGAPLSREVGEGLPKVREFWWELSLGPYPGMGAEFIRLAARSLIKGRSIP